MHITGTKLLTIKRALELLIADCEKHSNISEHDVIEHQNAKNLLDATNFNIEKEGVEA